MDLDGPLFYLLLPVFGSFVLAEWIIGRAQGKRLYTSGETLATLGVAVGQRLLGDVKLAATAFLALPAWDHRIATITMDSPASLALALPLLFIGTEFTYYWFHRFSHESRWLWATHAVHHSIEEMNILGAYRLGWTSMVSLGFIFHLPLVWLGFHPAAVAGMLSANLLYQSWLHTTLIGRLGPLEGWLNTPNAHRVHHARNADYLDRNHGGVTMVFDRLFGTWADERPGHPPEFGLVTPTGSRNPFVIALHEWVAMASDLRRHALRHWPMLMFGPPGWRPGGKGCTSADLRARWRLQQGIEPDPGVARAAGEPTPVLPD